MWARAWSLDIMKDNTAQEEYFGWIYKETLYMASEIAQWIMTEWAKALATKPTVCTWIPMIHRVGRDD